MTVAVAEMPYFEPQEKRTKQLTARIAKSVQDGLNDLSRLWTELERLQSGDKESEVTVSDVVNRLLKLGINGAWDEIGFRPETEAEWARAIKRAQEVFSGKKK